MLLADISLHSFPDSSTTVRLSLRLFPFSLLVCCFFFDFSTPIKDCVVGHVLRKRGSLTQPQLAYFGGPVVGTYGSKATVGLGQDGFGRVSSDSSTLSL